MLPPAAPDTTGDRYSLVDTPNNNTTEYRYSIPKSGYGFLEALVNTFKGYSVTLAGILEKTHERHGRRGYSAQSMLCVLLIQFLIPNQRYSSHYLRHLDGRPRLLAMCGVDSAPSEWAYCRFKKKLAKHRRRLRTAANRAARDCAAEIERLREQGLVPEDAPRLGEMLALDPTDIEAWAQPVPEHCSAPEKGSCKKKHKVHCDSPAPGECTKHTKRCTDPDARWGWRTAKSKSGNAQDKMEPFFGYKAHVVADTYHGIPLHLELRPANENENPEFAGDLDAVLERHRWLRAKYVIADKGYDSLNNFEHTVKKRSIPIIAVRKPKEDNKTSERLFDGTYTKDGRPVCLGKKPMTWLGTDPDGAHHFRCPPEDCRLKDKVDWTSYCNSEHSERPEGKLLRIMGIVPRFSKAWKELYKKRTGIERWFSSGKRSRLLDSHQHVRKEKIELHAEMSMLASSLTTLTHLRADDYEGMRHMTIRVS